VIKDRQYGPTDGQLMYHYCSASAFEPIIRTQTMWHTASTTLNDATERKWGFDQFQKVCDELRKYLGADFIDRITEVVRFAQDHAVAMISCYSLNGDLLSQWRAYADDGRGFSIGFSPRELEMPANRLRVLYDRAAQRLEIKNNISHVFKVEREFGFRYDDRFRQHSLHFGIDLCAYKHPSFAEELEVRAVHITGAFLRGAEQRLIPLGAIDGAGVRRSGPVPINYRDRNGVQIPYVSLDIADGGKNSPIKEVVLGPKNPNKESDVEQLLTDAGLKGVKVYRSDAPYV
jgi:hypothetical protein